jgi:hypothetical protein
VSWTQYRAARLFDRDLWGPDEEVTFTFVAWAKRTGSAGALVRLWNVTDGVEVARVETASTSYVRLESGSFTLSGAKEYRAEVGVKTAAQAVECNYAGIRVVSE